MLLKLGSIVKYKKHECMVDRITKSDVTLICTTKKRKYTYVLTLKEVEALEVLQV